MNLNTSPQRKKILITVKTYPTLSSKYDELVCTAGITEDGEWIRLYPMPFRQLEFDQQYKKYQWVELEVEKRTEDPRPESYRPLNIDRMVKHEYIDTKNDWSARKSLVLKNVYEDMDKLIAANKNDSGLSLAVFKPKEILDFTIEPCNREWDKKKLSEIKARANQLDLFGEKSDNPFDIVRKLPCKFKYKFKDIKGKESHIMVEDWELGQLFWNCLSRNNGDESVACKKVRKKYLEEFRKKDLYFYMGTTRQYDGWSKNPFLIIGVFYPPKPQHCLCFDFLLPQSTFLLPLEQGKPPYSTKEVPYFGGDCPFLTGEVASLVGDHPFSTGEVAFLVGNRPFLTGEVAFLGGDCLYFIFPKARLLFPKAYLAFPRACLAFPRGFLVFPRACLAFPRGFLVFPKAYLAFPKACLAFPRVCLVFPKAFLVFPPHATGIPLGKGSSKGVLWTFGKGIFTLPEAIFTLPESMFSFPAPKGSLREEHF